MEPILNGTNCPEMAEISCTYVRGVNLHNRVCTQSRGDGSYPARTLDNRQRLYEAVVSVIILTNYLLNVRKLILFLCTNSVLDNGMKLLDSNGLEYKGPTSEEFGEVVAGGSDELQDNEYHVVLALVKETNEFSVRIHRRQALEADVKEKRKDCAVMDEHTQKGVEELRMVCHIVKTKCCRNLPRGQEFEPALIETF